MENIRVLGLSHLESMDLKKQYPEAQITFEKGVLRDPEHGELLTIALIGLTVAGLNVLAAWLLKDNKSNIIEKSLEVIGPDGSKRIEKIKIKVSESTTQADVVKALAPGMRIDLSQLHGA